MPLTDKEVALLQRRKALQQEIRNLEKEANELLPEFPEDTVCRACGHTDWMHGEEGYGRFTRVEFAYTEESVEADDPKPLIVKDRWGRDLMLADAYTDGWDDMTENGDFQYFICRNCWHAFKMPNVELEWT